MKKKTAKPKKSKSGGKTSEHRAKVTEIRTPASMRSPLASPAALGRVSDDDASETAGQAGDLQGISKLAEADPESVEELLEDGQAYEAEIVEGVEDAQDEKPVPRRGRLEVEGEPPHDFEDRNKI